MPEPVFPPHGALMRRFALAWLGCLDPTVPAQIMAPDYLVTVGEHVLSGLDAYVGATVGVYERYLGLLLTVHDSIATAGRTALRFTLHGAEPDAAAVAWGGIALFRHDGRVLVSSFVEEDYLARRRQQLTGVPDPVEPPMPAPWAVPELAPNPAAEAAVRNWLASGDLSGDGRVALDDAAAGQPPMRLLGGPCQVNEIFSAGDRVAFRARQTGDYLGGLPGAEGAIGQSAAMSVAGIVHLGPQGVGGHAVRDRLGLRRRMMQVGLA